MRARTSYPNRRSSEIWDWATWASCWVCFCCPGFQHAGLFVTSPVLGFLLLPLCWVFFTFIFHRGSFCWVGLLLCLPSTSRDQAEVVSAKLSLRNGTIDVGGVCNFLGPVSPQQKVEAMDGSGVTAQFYLASKGKYIPEAWGLADPKDSKRREARG